MSEHMNMNVRISGALKDFVNQQTGESGTYESVSEYVRDLIRRDADLQNFLETKRILQEAFSAPESEYVHSTPEDIFSRKYRKA